MLTPLADVEKHGRVFSPFSEKHGVYRDTSGCSRFPDHTVNQNLVQISPTTVSLWLSASVFSAFASFIVGASHVLTIALRYLTHGELEGSKAFAVNLPILFSAIVATIAAIVALVHFLISWLRERRPLLSWTHAIAVALVAPPIVLFFLFH